MRFVLEPPQGVGDIRLGTAPSELAQIISRYGEVREFNCTPEAQPGWMISAPGLIFFVYRDSGGLVDAIEIARPEEPSKIQVTYRDINLFAEPASSVVERLEQAGVDLQATEGGRAYTAKDLLLAFSRDDGPEGPDGLPLYLGSVLVARSDYYG